MLFDRKAVGASIAILATLLTAARIHYFYSLSDPWSAKAASAEQNDSIPLPETGKTPNEPASQLTVDLSDTQVQAIKIESIGYREFHFEVPATGNIDFNQDMSVQVFTPYQGRIISLHAKIGDEVQEGQTLFTIDSTDLLQAESTLIQTAGVLDLTGRALTRARKLVEIGGGAQKDLEQAISDQQTAEGAFRAARNALHLFGKSDADIDRVVADRRIDSTLIVPSPIAGIITARNAAPGLLVQPGNPPAPYTVADISTKWVNMNVVESATPGMRLGQEIAARVLAYPNRRFDGKVTTVAANVDPTTHRLLVRSEIADPAHLLRPGMFASCTIRIGDPIRSIAVPLNGIVREGDGTFSVWVTKDRHRFIQRTIHVGLQQDDYDQILDGVQAGELAVTEGAVFLSNKLAGAATD